MEPITVTEPVALTCAECGQTGTYVPGARYLAECSNPGCHHEVDARDLQPEDDEIVGFVGGILSVWTVPTDDDPEPEPEPEPMKITRCHSCERTIKVPARLLHMDPLCQRCAPIYDEVSEATR